MVLGDSLFSFFLHRDEEGLEGLKEQNWELPLQDGEGLWMVVVPANAHQAVREVFQGPELD